MLLIFQQEAARSCFRILARICGPLPRISPTICIGENGDPFWKFWKLSEPWSRRQEPAEKFLCLSSSRAGLMKFLIGTGTNWKTFDFLFHANRHLPCLDWRSGANAPGRMLFRVSTCRVICRGRETAIKRFDPSSPLERTSDGCQVSFRTLRAPHLEGREPRPTAWWEIFTSERAKREHFQAIRAHPKLLIKRN